MNAVNVRTYVRPRDGGPPGIFFFSLECSSWLAAVGARLLFRLPYRLARMQRIRTLKPDTKQKGLGSRLSSQRAERTLLKREPVASRFIVEWAPEGDFLESSRSSFEHFITERYNLYNESGCVLRSLLGTGRLWRGQITHGPWPVRAATLSVLRGYESLLQAADVEPTGPHVVHCSDGVKDITFFLMD